MKNLAILALLGCASAEWLCDDQNTANQNYYAGPLATALQEAKDRVDAAEKAQTDHLLGINDYQAQIDAAQENLSAATVQEALTSGRITTYHQAYADASTAFANCKPDDAGSTCDVTTQAVLQHKLETAGDDMIANDKAHQTNVNQVETYQLSLNQLINQKAAAETTASTTGARFEKDVLDATTEYTTLKAEYDAHTVSNVEAQESCKINQYHADMQEIARLTTLKLKCQTSGCTQADAEISDGINYTDQQVEGQSWHSGKIKFPDCGLTVTQDCFFRHYKKSQGLDVLSVLLFFPALLGCAVADEYVYDFCISNWAYVLVDSQLRKVAPPEVQIT